MLINTTLYRYKGFDITLDKYHSLICCYARNNDQGSKYFDIGIKIKVIGGKKYALNCLKREINNLLNKGEK